MYQLARLVEQLQNGGLFLARHLEEIRNVAPRHDNKMTGAQWILLNRSVCQVIVGQH
jgi:hypothetical protein